MLVLMLLQTVIGVVYYAPAPSGGIKQRCCLTSVWGLSIAYIGPKSRTERPRKTTRDSDTTFKVKMSKVKVTSEGILWRPPAYILLISVPKVHSLKSAIDCCQIQQDARGSARIAPAHQEFLHKKCPQMLEKEQWPPRTVQIWMQWRYRVSGATHKAILKPSSEAQNSFWI